MDVEIKLIDRGIAYSYHPNVIELNRNLVHVPELMQDLIEHEKEHISAKNIFHDVWIDLKDLTNLKKQKRMSQFIKQYAPEAGRQSAMPIWFESGQLVMNKPLLIIYSIPVLIGLLIVMVI